MEKPKQEIEKHNNVFLPAPEAKPTPEEPIQADDFDYHVSEGPSHGFDPPAPDIGTIELALESGQYVIQPASETRRPAPRRLHRFSRKQKIAASVVGVASIGGGSFYYNERVENAQNHAYLCTDSNIVFPENISINEVELCVAADGVYKDSSNSTVTAVVDTRLNLGSGASNISTVGDLAEYLGVPADKRPAPDIAAQSVSSSAYLLETLLARTKPQDPEKMTGPEACQDDLSSVIKLIKDNAGYYAENNLGGNLALTSEEIRAATNIRLVSRITVEGQENDEGRDIVCS